MEPSRKKIIYIFFFLYYILQVNNYCFAQYRPDSSSTVNIGIGLGIDYGGLGLRLTVLPDKHFNCFFAAGTNFVGFGYNVGAGYRISPNDKVCPYIIAMYGYNAAIKIENGDEYNKTYYGPSAGIGIEIHSKKRPGNYFNIELLFPITSEEFQNDLDDLKHNPAIEINADPPPIRLSFGYHIGS